ncbi:MAG TPA: M20/M25/M40 family metallo-hydrolase [Gaiellaceae bacterium]|nr:M20/M25/M40 family metallo-hydrolase [Gaiellaceae bacterium]
MGETVDLFLELAALPTPPGQERAAADVVLRYLRELGLEPQEDGTAAAVGSTAGNVYARLEPTTDGTPIFLCAHLDTVPLAGELRPVVEDGVVRNAGGTILGADNKAAVAAMLEGVRRVVATGRPQAGVELLFTTKEEVGLLGAMAFDHARLRARTGYVYDQGGPIGEIVVGAPWSRSFEVRFHGRAAHAGMFPEEGRSAIQAAARAIADLRLGRVDDDSTANVGLISGGTAGNVVPEWCTFVAEARSHDEAKLADLVQEMLDAVAFAASETECEVDTEVRKSYAGYRLRRDEPAVRLAAAALERCGHEVRFTRSGGAADANVFNERGRRCVNLANAMVDVHTPDERIAVADLEAMVDVTVALIEAASEQRLPEP